MGTRDAQAIEELLTRGVAEAYPSADALREALAGRKRLRIYTGIDPTAPTLHIGHLAALQKLRQFQDLGHEVIMLIGDFTGMIGDPSGKSKTRVQLTAAQVKANAKLYKAQASAVLRFSGKNAAKVRGNREWWGKMSAQRLLELLSFTTVQRLLERDMFEERMGWRINCSYCGFPRKFRISDTSKSSLEETKIVDNIFGSDSAVVGFNCEKCGKNTTVPLKPSMPIAAHEFTYPVLQGYDSVAMTVDVEVGGTDQTFNMLMGREYVKKLQDREKFVITVPLLADASGKKIGKTEGNMVELGATPENLYGQAMALPDGVVVSCFTQCTAVPTDDVRRMEQALRGGTNPRDLKMRLAHEFVHMRYGEKKADTAQAAFVSQFQKHEMPAEVRTLRKREFGDARRPLTLTIVDFLVHPKVRFVSSKGEARRVIAQRGVTVDGVVVTDLLFDVFSNMPDGGRVIQKGKRHFVRVIPT